MNNTIEYDLRKSLESFEKSFKGKLLKDGTEIEIFTEILRDVEELDKAMCRQMIANIQTKTAYEYEERDYMLDYDLHEGAITEEQYEKLSSEPIECNFETLGIDDAYNEGLFNSSKLGMYNVYKGLYENKCYNMNDEGLLLNTFTQYEKILYEIFSRYSKRINMNTFNAISRFEELFKNNLIF